MLKFLSLALGVSIGVALFMALQWYLFVTRTNNPHDEAGTALNAMMPDGVNAWGCRELKARFPDTVAPEGCKAAGGGQGWRE